MGDDFLGRNELIDEHLLRKLELAWSRAKRADDVELAVVDEVSVDAQRRVILGEAREELNGAALGSDR